MKYELLIGGIHLMHNVMVDCAKQQDDKTHAGFLFMVTNLSLPFLEDVLVIISIFLSSIAKNGYISKNDP